MADTDDMLRWFFRNKNVSVTWLDSKWDRSVIEGSVGENNEADLAVTALMCQDVKWFDCSQPTFWTRFSWVTRLPRPLPPATNLLRIYNNDCWCLIFLSMFCVSVFLVVAAKLGTEYGVGSDKYLDVALVPFRYYLVAIGLKIVLILQDAKCRGFSSLV